jgi:beta-mannanase
MPNPSMYYPGDDYVDIAALDVYVDNPVLNFVFFLFS